MNALALAVLVAAAPAESTSSVGDWVAYRVKGGIEARTHFWRFAVVGEERGPSGTTGQWLEVEMAQHASMRAPLLQARLFLSRAAPREPVRVTRAFVAWGMEPARELSPEAVGALFDTDAPRRHRRRSRHSAATSPAAGLRQLGRRSLMTNAGTVSASGTEARAAGVVLQRIWVSLEVPLLGLVRLEIPEIAHEIDLHGFGHDATARMLLPGPGQPTIAFETGGVPRSALAPLEIVGAIDAP